MSPTTEPGWFWRMLLWRLLGHPLGVPWGLLFLLLIGAASFIHAGMNVAAVGSVDRLLRVDSQTRAEFAYCQFLLEHPWIPVVVAMAAVILRWSLARRGYSWAVQQIAMFPIHAALVIHVMAMTSLGGRFIW